MSCFDLETTALGYVPREGWNIRVGQEMFGIRAFHRMNVQFMSGADIVDYSSVAINTSDPLCDIVVSALDTRAGAVYAGQAPFEQFKSDCEMQLNGIESLSSTFVTDGFVEGTYISVDGFANPILNRMYFVGAGTTETFLSLERGGETALEAFGSGVTIINRATTSGYSPATGGQTWTLTCITDDTWTATGSVDGLLPGVYDATAVDHMAWTDQLFVSIIPGSISPTVGDTITFEAMDNPNSATNAPGQQWLDPEPSNGYPVPGTEKCRRETLPSPAMGSVSYNRWYNIRPLFRDTGGLGNPEDMVYMRMHVNDTYSSQANDFLYQMYQSMTGYAAPSPDGEQGNHPNLSPCVGMPFLRDSEIYGYICGDDRSYYPLINQNAAWSYSYVGLIDSYQTQSEYPYPMMVIGMTANNITTADNPGRNLIMGFIGGGGYYSSTYPSVFGYSFTPTGVWENMNHGSSNDAASEGPSRFYPMSPTLGTDVAQKIFGCFRPTQLGSPQIPLIPLTIQNWPGAPSGDKLDIGDPDNVYDHLYSFGEMRNVACVPITNLNEGDILETNGVKYLCIRGRNMASTATFGFRIAFKLA